jgi:ankyrin repeat protein
MDPEENESSLPELLLQGVDLDFTYNVAKDIVTPLMIACLDDNIMLARHLIQAGANVNQANPAGITALMMIAEINNPFAMQQLIDNPNININQKDNEGNTALMHAIRAKNKLAIKALLDSGANPDLPNKKGITPLQVIKNLESLKSTSWK